MIVTLSSPIADYSIIKTLGKGAFGTTFLAVSKDQQGVDKKYVVKVIDQLKLSNDDFIQELNALNEISNVNECKQKGVHDRSVLCLVESFVQDGSYVIVTNYLENVITLRSYLRNFKEYKYLVNIDHVIFIMTRLINQLLQLHNNNIVHGDIKPENIVLQLDNDNKYVNNIMFIDYGLSCITEQCNIGGTLLYMAPELLPLIGNNKTTISKQLLKKTDIWSLGVVFYELLHNNLPYPFYDDLSSFEKVQLSTGEKHNYIFNDNILILKLNSMYKKYKSFKSMYPVRDEYYDILNEIVDKMLIVDPKNRVGTRQIATMINKLNFKLFTNIIKVKRSQFQLNNVNH